MPTIKIERYKFRFYSSDVGEPPHVHVIDGDLEAKIWLRPVSVEYNHGYNRSQLDYILKLTRENQARLLRNWNEYFAR
ncbi:MAG TPA: DUF4160 domain-containing protein [Verrucomicrobiae bacterium]|nr:DUF4160 domain-containing protein [Verrucomicrobiae bacterium]